MNTFFYAAGESDSSRRYLQQLSALSELDNMTILAGDSPFLSPSALSLRSGDLLLLFAADSHELDHLLRQKHSFTNFRVILILADSDRETIRKAHFLQPSFIAFLEDKTITIDAVIKKMTADSPGVQTEIQTGYG